MIEAISNNPFRILGVYSNSGKKELLANESKLRAFLKVGKTVSFPTDFPGFLPMLSRDEAAVSAAQSALDLPDEQVKHGLFWFVNAAGSDTVAFNHLSAGDVEGAKGIWLKVSSSAGGWSARQNLMLVAACQADWTTVAQCCNKLYSTDAELLRGAISEVSQLDGGEMRTHFLDTIEAADSTALLSLSRATGTSLSWRAALKERTTAPLIAQVEAAVEVAQNAQKRGAKACLRAGKALINKAKGPLNSLKDSLGAQDLHYQGLADKVANTVQNLCVAYYNASEDDDKATQALPLQQFASATAAGPVTKSRCQENAKRLQEAVDAMPDMEIVADVKAITNNIARFKRGVENIDNAMTLLRNCREPLQRIKNVLGSNNEVYLKMSTVVVSAALSAVVDAVNEAQEQLPPATVFGGPSPADLLILSFTLDNAEVAMQIMDGFDLEFQFKSHYDQNRRSLRKIKSDVDMARGVQPSPSRAYATTRPHFTSSSASSNSNTSHSSSSSQSYTSSNSSSSSSSSSNSNSNDDSLLSPGCWVVIVIAIIIIVIMHFV